MNRGNFFKLTASGIALPALDPVRRYWALGSVAKTLEYWDLEAEFEANVLKWTTAVRAYERAAMFGKASHGTQWIGGPAWGEAPIRVNIQL